MKGFPFLEPGSFEYVFLRARSVVKIFNHVEVATNNDKSSWVQNGLQEAKLPHLFGRMVARREVEVGTGEG